jgi:FolB domain-containing protein
MSDLIRIVELQVETVIGVYAHERTGPQNLVINLELRVRDIGPAAYTDNVNLAIDYAAVAERVRMMASSHPRNLIEALAEDIATDLLKAFPLVSLKLEVVKFALPNAHHVSLIIERPMDNRLPTPYRPSPTQSLRFGPNPAPGR